MLFAVAELLVWKWDDNWLQSPLIWPSRCLPHFDVDFIQFVQRQEQCIPKHELSRSSLSKVIIIPTYWCDQSIIETLGAPRCTPAYEVFLRSLTIIAVRISARTLYWNCGVAGTVLCDILAATCLLSYYWTLSIIRSCCSGCSQLLLSATVPIDGFSHTCPVVNSMFGVVPPGHLLPTWSAACRRDLW